MNTNQDWIEAYKELCILIETKVPEIKHIDMDHDQLMFEQEEYPFPETALFMDFSTESIQTVGLKVQNMNMQVKFTLAFDTLSDTFHHSDNQAISLAFGGILRKLHKLLQGKSGTHFSSLDRIGLRRAPAPEACIAYSQIYTCIIVDYAAMDETTEGDMLTANIKMDLRKGEPPAGTDMKLFEINM